MINTAVIGNFPAPGNEKLVAGGILMTHGTITDSLISNNTANFYPFDVLFGLFSSYTVAAGGGVVVGESVTITNSTISNNTATAGAGAGGLYVGVGATVLNSTISDNTGIDGAMGGISVGASAGALSAFPGRRSLELRNSTISGNEAQNPYRFSRPSAVVSSLDQVGGGIFGLGVDAVIDNSTIANNQINDSGTNTFGDAVAAGIGLFGSDPRDVNGPTGPIPFPFNSPRGEPSSLVLTNSTVYGNGGNLPSYGVWVNTSPAVSVARNSIIANNSFRSGVYNDVIGGLSGNNNLLSGSADGGSTLVNGVNGNLLNVANPGVGTLQNNGGPTLTMALLPGSPAIGAGSSTGVQIDQRFYQRKAQRDIGAYETGATVNSLIVTTTADENNGSSDPAFGTGTSLREALATAAFFTSVGIASQITFELGTAPQTINLSSALPTISQSISIAGPGSDLLTLRRNTGGNYRLLNLASGVEVSLSGITLTNGRSGSNPGGAILNAGTLLLEDVALIDNRSTSTGGAIHNSGTLDIRSSSLRDNVSDSDGGAIYNTGTLTISDSTIADNLGLFGGGVHTTSLATLNRTTVDDNDSQSDGGGVYVSASGQLTLNNSNLVFNLSGNNGGAVAVAGRLDSNNNTFDANYANGRGGAVYTTGDTNIDASIFNQNAALARGGAVYGVGGTLDVNTSTFELNESSTDGGAIAILGNTLAKIQRSTLANNTATLNGGAFYTAATASQTAEIYNSTLHANTANGDGGAIFATGGATLISIYNTIADNQSGVSAAFVSSGFTAVQNNLIVRNTKVANSDPANYAGGLFGGTNLIGIANPGLANSLADNGGPTRTLALILGSPAINAGSVAPGLDIDQRGVARPFDGVSDIGAFERAPAVQSFVVTTLSMKTTATPTRHSVPAPVCAKRSASPNPRRTSIPSPSTRACQGRR